MTCRSARRTAAVAVLVALLGASASADPEDSTLMSSRVMRGQVPYRKGRKPVSPRPLTGNLSKVENPEELAGFLIEPLRPPALEAVASQTPGEVSLPAATGLGHSLLQPAVGAPPMPPMPPLPGVPSTVPTPPVASPPPASTAALGSTSATASGTAPPDLNQMITVDLRDTDIKHFIKILSEQTQTNWVFDPGMSGKINMLGPQRMTLGEAQHLLKSILEFKDFTIEAVGGINRIVPRAQGKFRNTELRLDKYVEPEGYPLSEDKLVTQLVRLRFRNVNEVRGVLVNFAKDAAAILPYAPTNSLFITDNGTYIHRLMKIIRELDTPDPAKKVEVFHLQYSFVKQILQPLNDILKQTRGLKSATVGAAPQEGAPPPPPPQPGAPASSPNPAFIVDEADNAIVAIAYQEELDSIEDAIRLLDKDPDHVPMIKVVAVRYSDPDTVSKLVTDAFKSDPALNNSIKSFAVTPDKRTGSLMVTTYSPKMMDRLVDLIQKLDIPVVTAGAAVRVYKLEYAEAKKVAEVINGLGGGEDEIATSVVGSSSTTGSAGRSTVGAAQGYDSAGRPLPAPSSGANGSAAAKKTTVIADEATNSLVIIATREKFTQLTNVIKELDVVRPQVLVEVLIARIDVDHARHLGLDFNAVNQSGNSSRPFFIGSTGQLTNLFSLAGVRSGLNLGLLDKGDFDISAAARGDLSQLSKIGVLINILTNDSRANILSAPKLLTGDNQEAKITVGSQVRIPQGSTLNAINTITNFVTEDLGVILNLTPRITKNDFVAMKIKTQIKNLVPNQAVAGIPVISNSDIETNITVENKATIAMGGLIQEDERKIETKIPLLGDLPLVGRLFRDTQTNKTKSNLLIFMTPHIIRTSMAARAETKRISPVLRFVKIKERKRGDTTNAGDLLKSMNEAK